MKQLLSILWIILVYWIYYWVNWIINKDVRLNNEWVDLSEQWFYTWALEKHDMALALKPEDPLYNFNKAFTLYDQWDYNRALVFFDNAIKYSNNNDIELAEMYSHRWATYHELYEYDKFTADIEKSLDLNPDDFWGLYFDSVIKNYSDSYDFTWALESIDRLIALDPLDAEAFSQKWEIFYYASNLTWAIDAYTKSIELDPENSFNHLMLGHSFLWLPDYNLSLESYKNAYEKDKLEYLNVFYVWYSLLKLSKYKESEEYFYKSFELEWWEEDEILKLFILLLKNKFDSKEDVEKFLTTHYEVWFDKLEELLAFIEIYEEYWYTELEYEISNFKRDNE